MKNKTKAKICPFSFLLKDYHSHSFHMALILLTHKGLGEYISSPRTIATTPPAIEISTPQEIIAAFPHPPLFSHDGYCLGVDVKPSALLSCGLPASPPWGSRSRSSLTPAHEVRFTPLPRTCFAPRLAFCMVGELRASFTVGVTVPESRSKKALTCWACTSDRESLS